MSIIFAPAFFASSITLLGVAIGHVWIFWLLLFGTNEINRWVLAGFCQQPALRLEFFGRIYSQR
jgi:hypothetical protein